MFGFTMSVRRIAVAALLGVSMTLGAIGSASAAGASTSIVLSPGARACLPPIYAVNNVDAQGSASPGARWTVNYSPNGGTYNAIYDTYNATQGFRAIFSYSFGNFPGAGYYKLCARNTGTTGAQVFMSINGY